MCEWDFIDPQCYFNCVMYSSRPLVFPRTEVKRNVFAFPWIMLNKNPYYSCDSCVYKNAILSTIKFLYCLYCARCVKKTNKMFVCPEDEFLIPFNRFTHTYKAYTSLHNTTSASCRLIEFKGLLGEANWLDLWSSAFSLIRSVSYCFDFVYETDLI